MATSTASPVKVAPSVLTWARESMGLTHQDVARAIKKDENLVLKWESGDKSPTLADLEKLAYKVYKRPLVVFFLPAPPTETTSRQDFRTLSDKDASVLSPSLRLLIRKSKHHQVALKELYQEKNPSIKQIHKELSFSLKLDVRNAAEQVRSYYNLTIKETQDAIKTADAFKKF